MTGRTPASQDIRDALDRVASSEEFRASPNLTAFLRFIVERTVEGREDTIKAYTVATEVLGRPASFDPQADPIVRVEATRLRRALERYYGRAGDSLLIEVPRGSYVPHFRFVEEASSAAAPAAPVQAAPAPVPSDHPAVLPAPPAAAGRPVWQRLAVAVVLVVPVLAVIVDIAAGGTLQTLFASRQPEGPPTLAALGPERPAAPGWVRPALSLTKFGTVLMAPIMETTPAGRTHAAILTDVLRDGLVRFEDVGVIEVKSELPEALPPPAEDTYLLTGRLTRQGPVSKVTLRLRHEASQQIVWSGDFNVAVGDGPGLSENNLMRRVAAALMTSSGVIAGDVAGAKHRADPLSVPAACMMYALKWLATSQAGSGEVAEACLNKAVENDPRFAGGWAMLARTSLETFRLSGEADASVLDRALTQARTAVSLAPQSARAQQVLSDVLAALGDRAGAQAAIDRAWELNPYSIEVMQSSAARLIEAGDYRNGIVRLNDIAAAGAPDDPWRTLLNIVALTSTNAPAARLAALSDVGNHPAALLSATIVRAYGQQSDAGRVAGQKLAQLFPAVARDPEGFLRRLGLPAGALTSLEGPLRSANLPPSRS